MKQLPTIILFISLTGGLFSNIELYYQNNLGDFLNTKQSLKKSLIKEAEINDFNLVFSEGLQLLMLKSDKSTLYPQNSLITFYSQIGNSTDKHLSLTPSALQLTLQSYNTLLNPSKSTSLLLPLDHRSTYSEFNFAMTTAYTLGENLQFNIGGEVNDLTFNPNTTNRNLRNRSVFTIPVNLSYSITPDVNLRVGLTTKGTRLEKGLTYHDKLVNVGVEGKISKNLSSEFSVGVQDRSLNKTPLSEDLATSTKLNYKLTDKTSAKAVSPELGRLDAYHRI